MKVSRSFPSQHFSCLTKSKAKYFHVLIPVVVVVYLNNEFNIVTIFQTVSSFQFEVSDFFFPLKCSILCRMANCEAREAKDSNRNNEKKATRKISIYCFFDWFMYIKTYICEGIKNGRREILHNTDTCDLPFCISPTARKPRDIYISNLENLLATYYLVCACFAFDLSYTV